MRKTLMIKNAAVTNAPSGAASVAIRSALKAELQEVIAHNDLTSSLDALVEFSERFLHKDPFINNTSSTNNVLHAKLHSNKVMVDMTATVQRCVIAVGILQITCNMLATAIKGKTVSYELYPEGEDHPNLDDVPSYGEIEIEGLNAPAAYGLMIEGGAVLGGKYYAPLIDFLSWFASLNSQADSFITEVATRNDKDLYLTFTDMVHHLFWKARRNDVAYYASSPGYLISTRAFSQMAFMYNNADRKWLLSQPENSSPAAKVAHFIEKVYSQLEVEEERQRLDKESVARAQIESALEELANTLKIENNSKTKTKKKKS